MKFVIALLILVSVPYFAFGQMSFTEVSDTVGLPNDLMSSFAVVDFDFDGDDDLFMQRDSDSALLYFENQNGFFVDQSSTISINMAKLWSIRFLDYDKDGDLDLLGVMNEATVTQELKLFTNDQLTFSDSSISVPRMAHNIGAALRIVDFDRDGDPDVVYQGEATTGFNLVLLRNGGGVFSTETLFDIPDNHTAGEFHLTDMNNDGFMDIVQGSMEDSGCSTIYYRTASRCLLLNDHGAGVTNLGNVGIPNMPLWNYVKSFDYDNDGFLDLFHGTPDYVCNGEERNWLLRNNGDNSFSNVSNGSLNFGSHYCRRITVGDVNQDGFLDYYQEVATFTHSRFFLGTGDGMFSEESETYGLDWTGGVDRVVTNTWIDFDRDGDLDLLRVLLAGSGAVSGNILLHRNDGLEGEWLEFALYPTTSIPSLIGTRVAVYTGDQTMTRFVDNYSSKSIHFGLGNTTVVDSVEIYWTSGEITRLSDVDSNQIIEVFEGEEPVANFLSWVDVQSVPGGISVGWSVSEPMEIDQFSVQREEGDGDFQQVLSVGIDRTSGGFRLVDSDLRPSSTYRYQVSVSTVGGSWVLFTTEFISTPSVRFDLNQNHPNPFNPSTTINFSLPESSPVTLRVYDISGKLVRDLISSQVIEAGLQEKVWNGKDDHDQFVSAGIYFYKLTAGNFTETRRMALVK
jgi:hypothetical protein